MDRYKTRIFQRWAVKENISDKILNKAIEEFVEGLYEATLGKGLYKKRIPHKGKGKRGGARSILFYRTGKVFIFCVGYPKNVQEDLNKLQRKKLEFLAREFQKMGRSDFRKALEEGKLIKIEEGEQNGS